MCQMRQNSGSTGFSGWLPLPACGVLPAAPYTVDGDLGAGPGFEGFDMQRAACGEYALPGGRRSGGKPWYTL